MVVGFARGGGELTDLGVAVFDQKGIVMSRNFELLQNLGKEGTFVELDAPVEVEQHQPVADPIAQDPQIKLDPKQREELMKVAQRIFLQPKADRPRIVVFAATEAGNGCSFVCACTGALLASQMTGSVCLVDANLGNPSLHKKFGVENGYGLADALRGSDSIFNFARSMSSSNLWLVSGGSSSDSALPLLNSGRMRQLITELRTRVDCVLIDASAINLSNDAVSIAGAADGMVIVLKANSSRRETVRKAVHDMQSAHVRILGAVLNQRTFPVPAALYHRL
jgi:Mrp family chromosome partitioning ATPase